MQESTAPLCPPRPPIPPRPGIHSRPRHRHPDLPAGAPDARANPPPTHAKSRRTRPAIRSVHRLWSLTRTQSLEPSLRAQRGNLVRGTDAAAVSRSPRRYAPRDDNLGM